MIIVICEGGDYGAYKNVDGSCDSRQSMVV
jgi:hypothetical protein